MSLSASFCHITLREGVSVTDKWLRKASCLIVVFSVFAAAESATFAQTRSVPAKRSTAKRVTWTIVGAAAGFGLGTWFGLTKFDDAINSDRKVWTSAIVGAAAGGLAGGLLSRNVRPALPLVNAPAFHHQPNFSQPCDVLGRITLNGDDVGLVANLQRADAVGEPKRFGSQRCR